MVSPERDDAGLLRDFIAGRDTAVSKVQGWVDGVVLPGRWRFADPESVSQEIVLKLLHLVRADGFTVRSSFKGFVFAVARHTCVDLYRVQRTRRRLDDQMAPGGDAVPPVAENEVYRQERGRCLQFILQQLPDDCRRLFRWIYQDEISAVEIARRLGIRHGAARVRVHRCLQKARQIGARYPGAPLGGES